MAEDKKISTAAEVLERFKKSEPEIVEYQGVFFKIKKLQASSMLSEEMLAIPFVKEAMAKWKDMSDDERNENTTKFLLDADYRESIKKMSILEGVLEPKFSLADPCPEDMVPYDKIDGELKEFLSSAVLTKSNFDKKAVQFFRERAS